MCQTVVEADVLKIALEEAGIDSTVDGAALNTTFGPMAGHVISGVRLIVRQEDADDALEVIQSTRDSWVGPVQDPWFCGKCLEEIEGGFEICWSCGKTRDEVETDFPATADSIETMPVEDVDSSNLGRATDNPYESPRAMGVVDPDEPEQDPEEADAESRMVIGLLISGASFLIPVLPAVIASLIFSSAFRKRLPLSRRAKFALWAGVFLIVASQLMWLWIFNFPPRY